MHSINEMGERNLVSVMTADGHYGNRLNHFTQPLNHPLYFPEKYSLAITEISFPNLIRNINNCDNVLSLSFYKRGEGNDAYNEVVSEINGENHTLISHINIPIKSAYYPNLDAFSEHCMEHINLVYNTRTNAPIDTAINFKLFCIDSASVQHGAKFPAFSTKLKKDLMTDCKRLLPPDNLYDFKEVTNTIMDVMQNMLDKESVNPKSLWNNNSVLWKLDSWALWCQTFPDEEEYHLPGYVKPTGKHSELMITIYDHLRNVFCAIRRTTTQWDIRGQLMARIQFYLFVCSIKIVYQADPDDEDDDNDDSKEFFWEEYKELLSDLYDFIEDIDERRIDEHGLVSHDGFDDRIVSVIHNLCKARSFYKSATSFSPVVDFKLKSANVKAMRLGVNRVIDKFFRDVKAHTESAKNYADELMLPPTKALYIESLTETDYTPYHQHSVQGENKDILDLFSISKHDYNTVIKGRSEESILLNPSSTLNHRAHKQDVGPKINFLREQRRKILRHFQRSHYVTIYENVQRMISCFFKGFLYDGNRVRLTNNVTWPGTNTPADVFTNDYVKIRFVGNELPYFFGSDGHRQLIVEKNTEFIFPIAPELIYKNANLYLYCSQIEPQFVNNVMAPLLALIPIGSQEVWGGGMHHIFKTPRFLNLNTMFLEKLEFTIRNRDGDEIKFEDSSYTVTINTVVRPSTKGII